MGGGGFMWSCLESLLGADIFIEVLIDIARGNCFDYYSQKRMICK
jgi:hypothetical protein